MLKAGTAQVIKHNCPVTTTGMECKDTYVVTKVTLSPLAVKFMLIIDVQAEADMLQPA